MALNRFLRSSLWGLAAAVLAAGMVLLAPGVSSLVLGAFIVAYVIVPVVDALERRRVPREAGVVLVLGGAGLLVAGMLLLLVPLVVDQARLLSQRLPEAVTLLETRVLPWVERTFGVALPHDREAYLQQLKAGLQQLGPKLAAPLSGVLARSFSGALHFVGAVANLVLLPVVAFYVARDYHRIWPRLEALVPRDRVARVRELVGEIDRALGGFVRGQLTVALILGVIYAIGLSLAGIEGAVVIGFLSGLLNLVPYLGTGLGVGLSLTVALISFAGWGPVIGVLVVFVLGQLLEGLVITPRVVGEQVGLSAVVVILAVMTGGEIFGFAGVLLAVPAAAALKVLARAAVETYRSSDVYRGVAQDSEAG